MRRLLLAAPCAALLQLASHGERLGSLDAREAAHYQEIAPRLHQLTADAASLNTTITRINETLRRHSMIVNGLDGLDRQVEELARSMAQPTGSGDADGQPGYQPVSPPRWWKPRSGTLSGGGHAAGLPQAASAGARCTR